LQPFALVAFNRIFCYKGCFRHLHTDNQIDFHVATD
jgi:hypothetical protein